MSTSLQKKFILFLLIFISTTNITFAQQNNKNEAAEKTIKEKKYDGSYSIPIIASTVSVGLALQISGIVLLTIAHQYYYDEIDLTKKPGGIDILNQTYLITGSSLFAIGTISTITGVIFAIINAKPKKKQPILNNVYTNKHGSLNITTTQNSKLHFYTNAFYVEITY